MRYDLGRRPGPSREPTDVLYPEYDAYERPPRRTATAAGIGLVVAGGVAGTYFAVAGSLGGLLGVAPAGSTGALGTAAQARQPGSTPAAGLGTMRGIVTPSATVAASPAATSRPLTTIRHPGSPAADPIVAPTCPCPPPPVPTPGSPTPTPSNSPSTHPSPSESPSPSASASNQSKGIPAR
jgi:hypothetical protein